MLDLGFRDELEAILGIAPPGHRTHLVSATFPRDVLAARRTASQTRPRAHRRDAARNGERGHRSPRPPGRPQQTAVDAISTCCSRPRGRRRSCSPARAPTSRRSRRARRRGLRRAALSGEMEQAERNRALAAFKQGTLHALVATDVAARGIDVQDIARVDPRRAADRRRHVHASQRANGARRAQGDELRDGVPRGARARLAAPETSGGSLSRGADPDGRGHPARCRRADPRGPHRRGRARERGGGGRSTVFPESRRSSRRLATSRGRLRVSWRGHTSRVVPSRERCARCQHRSSASVRCVRRAPRTARAQRPPEPEGGWVPFRFTWGKEHGADPRRLVAMACRRGGIRSGDIGAIFVARTHSIVNIASPVAASFARSASEHDPRDPRVTIRPEGETRDTRPAPPRHHEPRPQEPRHASRPHEPRPREPRPREPRSHAPQAHEPRPHTSRPQHPRSPDPRPHAPRPDVPKPLPSRPRPPGPRRHVTHERPSQSGGERRPERPKR